MFKSEDLLVVEKLFYDRIAKDGNFTVGAKIPTLAMRDMIIKSYQTDLERASRDLRLHYYVAPVVNIIWGHDNHIAIDLYWKPITN